ncbi:protein ClpB [Seminavis robusta]|uniref:Protein ClpB n=1 Tax=Seminavis robusta TaxID=568900 RepID=A0A9N8DCD3_9STRA|nr:protein ClpB [Seminavis robusta]|eukprot:Sro32_g020900.1 protein ClpB (610) ;mRNA; f:105942-107771
MSTLEFLDEQGSVKSFGLVPWTTLHRWLSAINGHPTPGSALPRGVNRGKIIEELEARRKRQDALVDSALRMFHMDRGFGKDWREHENAEGYTHLEELLIYQPKEWRKQAREYLFRFRCDLSRESPSDEARTLVALVNKKKQPIAMKTPILVVLFHPEISRTARYEPLNFLLAYGVKDPLPALFRHMPEADRKALMDDLSPLDYFLEFQNYVGAYKLDILRKVGKEASLPRLCLIKELDFSDIIGQRLAKQFIRQSVVSHVSNMTPANKGRGMCVNRHPLSMIFAGPSGNGKTELARWLAKLMNKPSDDFFIKVDCGKLTDASEVFGRSGAYQGAQQGSALNNFVLKMSLEPQAVGIVLLDEIEKASQGVIHALYQVIDKGEWTNKRLGSHGAQTDVIPCQNLIFIMTTNACDIDITEFVKQNPDIYNAVGDELNQLASDLSLRIRNTLQFMYPFTEAFLGRIGRIVPFLPMANGNPDLQGIMHGESLTVAKLLIERQQEKFADSTFADIQQLVSPGTKHQIAKIVVNEAIAEAGVRGIQSLVEQKMGDRVLDAVLLERGGIEDGSHVRYYTREEAQEIDFRVEDLTEMEEDDIAEEENFNMLDDADLFG